MTQLGLIPSLRTRSLLPLSQPHRELRAEPHRPLADWLRETFGIDGSAFIAPNAVPIEGKAPRAAISLGVGENESKRIGGDFEAQTDPRSGAKIPHALDRSRRRRRRSPPCHGSGRSVWMRRPRPLLGRLFRRIRLDHLAVRFLPRLRFRRPARRRRAGVPLITIFRGAPSERFRQRWAPSGRGPIEILDADSLSPAAILERL